MSNWKTLAHDYQRTSADPDGNITSLAEIWTRYGGSDSKNGWAGGAITDSDSIYYFYTSYYSTIGGTGDRFSLNKYNKDGSLIWSNKQLGGHNTRKMWPTKIGNTIFYHDYKFGRVDIFTGVDDGAYISDSYGTIVANSSDTKMFSSRVASNEGQTGEIWFKGIDATVYPSPIHTETLWTRNAAVPFEDKVVDNNKLSVAYDNSKIFYAPNYNVIYSVGWNYPSGLYCWDDDGTLQWSIATTPLQFSAISAGNSKIYMYEGSSLVARNQSNGAISWTAVISGTLCTAQPPVLANSLAIIATSTGVHAYNATTGALSWTAAISDIDFTDPNNNSKYTVLAAASTSNTLIVTALGGVYILNLTDGSQLQIYNPPSITGVGARPVNPIVVNNRVYITSGYDNYSIYYPQALICLENNTTPIIDVTPPSAPGNPTFSSVTTSHITVSWTASTDNIHVSYYNLYYRILGGTWDTIVKTTLSHTFTGLTTGTYEFYVNAVDSSGNISSNSATTSQATTPLVSDVTPPSTPGDPTFSNVTMTSITASWTASADNVAISYYNLYYRVLGSSWSVITKTTTFHTFTGLTNGTTYEFYVNAVDTSGNASGDSSTTSQATVAIVVDTTSPSAPGNPSFSSVTSSSMIVSWTAATDNVAVSYYILFYRQSGGNWASIDKTTLNHSFTGLTDNTTYEFYVYAVDSSGNIGVSSTTTSQITSVLPLFTQLTGVVLINPTTNQRTIHSLDWTPVNTTMALQRRTAKTSYSTIYTGNPPYSYSQTDLKNNYYYRILLNGITPSNEVILKSARK